MPRKGSVAAIAIPLSVVKVTFMTIRKLQIPFLTAEGGASALETGIIFAKRYNAHLDVIHLRQRLPVPAGSFFPVAVHYIEENLEAFKAAENELAQNLKKRFEELCKKHAIEIADISNCSEMVGDGKNASKGPFATWSDRDANLPNDLSNRARLADMVIMKRPNHDAASQPLELALVEELVFQSARPVLIFDDEYPLTKIPETAMLAWDGGREAARAMTSALPLLKECQTVIVTSVGDLDWGTEPPENAAAFLHFHGVRATHLHVRQEKHQNAIDLFMEHAQKKDADLVVMGAYSHNKWREIILGGFTRHVLKHNGRPALICH
jgi:nucleotide-binding universal stress UspA family protein